jgi:hypothetical protein
MKPNSLLNLVLKNAKSHSKDLVYSNQLKAKLDEELKRIGIGTFLNRSQACFEIEYLTGIILFENSYYFDNRTFCKSGLNCDCDIPCGA